MGVHQGSVLNSQLFIVVLDEVDWKVPAVCLYKEMDDALDQANYMYRGLKLTEKAKKVIERIAYSLVGQVMTIDWGTLGGNIPRLLTWKKGRRGRGCEEDHNHDLCYRP